MLNNISKLRRGAGLSQDELAQRIGTKKTMLGKLERGERELTTTWIAKLADALGCSPSAIIDDTSIPVVGYVGAGARVYAFQDSVDSQSQDFVERPPSIGGDLVAVEVRGESMFPVAEEGWHLVYHKEATRDDKAFLNRLCVVSLADEDTMLVKRVMQGTRPGHYHLVSTNAPLIPDVRLAWAAVVTAIIPR